ncbi:MAG TPA: Flp pilus assembly protein CpaB [Candidatus Binatia bacterium]|jgi:pilus assembly protein CpaB
MRRYRPFLLLGLAAIIAFSTSSVAYRWLRAQSTVTQAPPVDTTTKVDVAVAGFDIPRGSTLTAEMIKTAKLDATTLPAGVFKSDEVSALIGRVAIVDVVQNEAILQAKLAPLDATRGVAALVDPAKRAMSVRVDDEVGVAGFVKPNDRVDIFVTLDSEEKGKGEAQAVTKLVLADTLVLAIGTELVRTGKDETATPVQVITLEVTPNEAEKLAFAATRGKFRLALRSPLTKEETLTPGATIESLLSSYQGGDSGTKHKNGSDDQGTGVWLIKGREVTFVPF